MQVVQDQQADLAGQHAVQGLEPELGGGGGLPAGVTEELQHRPVQILHAGVAGQAHPAHRPPLVPLRGERPVLGDLPAVELGREREDRGGLAQARESIHRHGALRLVAVLQIAVDDVPQVLVEGGELRGADRPQVRVPLPAGPVISRPLRRRQGPQGAPVQGVGAGAARRVDERFEVLLPRQRQVPRIMPGHRAGHTSSRASA